MSFATGEMGEIGDLKVLKVKDNDKGYNTDASTGSTSTADYANSVNTSGLAFDIDGNLAEEDRESPHMEQSCVAREGISDVVLSLEAVYAETRRY